MGGGSDHDQVQTFMRLDNYEQLEIMIKVDLLNKCRENLTKKQAHCGRLLKNWVKRIHATGAWENIDALEASGVVISTAKHDGERQKIEEVLLDLHVLVDYDTTKVVYGGNHPSVCNPTALTRREGCSPEKWPKCTHELYG